MIGYLVLGYPRTWDSFAWGAAIGIAAALATFAVNVSMRWSGVAVRDVVIAFFSAFITYEGVLYAATAMLPSSDEAFSLPVIMRIFEINCLAFAGLLVLHRLAMAIGLLVPASTGTILCHRA